jgi:hypothetical protein
VVRVGDKRLAYKLRPLYPGVIISEYRSHTLKSLGLAGIQAFDLGVSVGGSKKLRI